MMKINPFATEMLINPLSLPNDPTDEKIGDLSEKGDPLNRPTAALPNPQQEERD